jgi:dTDP-4-amino-4,6-dideoxygalactose transaminase
MIKINDLGAKVRRKRKEIDHAFSNVLDSGWLILGPQVQAFEKSFASYIGVEHCIGVANGTDALEIAFKAFDITVGDSVGFSANAGMYSYTALQTTKANPLFLDVDLSHKSVLLGEVERAIQLGVKAIVVTHLYGLIHPQINEIASLCKKNSVWLIEDCAQAHGAMLHQRKAGSFGDLATFSFYPTKNLGGLGDGGAVVTNSNALAASITSLRQYGWSGKYKVNRSDGRNSRLDELQAAILSTFLTSLDEDNRRRRKIAERFSAEILHPEISVPAFAEDEYVAHLYVIRTKQRDLLRNFLLDADIGSDIHYPIPDYQQTIFGKQYESLCLQNTELLSKQILTLPCHPELSDEEVSHIILTLNSWKN